MMRGIAFIHPSFAANIAPTCQLIPDNMEWTLSNRVAVWTEIGGMCRPTVNLKVIVLLLKLFLKHVLLCGWPLSVAVVMMKGGHSHQGISFP